VRRFAGRVLLHYQPELGPHGGRGAGVGAHGRGTSARRGARGPKRARGQRQQQQQHRLSQRRRHVRARRGRGRRRRVLSRSSGPSRRFGRHFAGHPRAFVSARDKKTATVNERKNDRVETDRNVIGRYGVARARAESVLISD